MHVTDHSLNSSSPLVESNIGKNTFWYYIEAYNWQAVKKFIDMEVYNKQDEETGVMKCMKQPA